MCKNCNCVKKELEIKVYKIDKDLPDFEKFDVGDWVDLRVSDIIELNNSGPKLLKQWDKKDNSIILTGNKNYFFKLGFSCKLPDGYEAYIAPRSSTYKKWGLRLNNSIGIIDNSYSGKDDEWICFFKCEKNCSIKRYDRIAQFRIQESMPKIKITYTDNPETTNRGGFGSTGES